MVPVTWCGRTPVFRTNPRKGATSISCARCVEEIVKRTRKVAQLMEMQDGKPQLGTNRKSPGG